MNRLTLLRLCLVGTSLLATLPAQEVQPTVIDSERLEMHSTDRKSVV